MEDKVSTVIKKLQKNNQTVSFAESCTGGLLSKTITDFPGVSKVFRGSVVTYSNESKQKLLQINPETIKKHGAVSERVARQMAKNIRKVFRSTYGVSVTGIAGPGGASDEKPVGLVYIGLASPKSTSVIRCFFKGGRARVRTQVLKTVFTALHEQFI